MVTLAFDWYAAGYVFIGACFGIALGVAIMWARSQNPD